METLFAMMRLRKVLHVSTLVMISACVEGNAHPLGHVQLRDGSRFTTNMMVYHEPRLTVDGGRQFHRQRLHRIDCVLGREQVTAAEGDRSASALRGLEQTRVARWFDASLRLQQSYPGSDGITLLDEVRYRLEPDGSYTRTHHVVVHVLSSRCVEQFDRLTGHYEPGRMNFSFSTVNVFTRKVCRHRYTAQRVFELAPHTDPRIYSSSVTCVYPVAELGRNMIIEFEYTYRYRRQGQRPFFFPRWDFQGGQPTARSRIVINVPRQTPFHYRLFNMAGFEPLVVDETVADERRVIVSLQSVAPFLPEAQSAQYEDVAPLLRGADIAEWTPLFARLEATYRQRIAQSPALRAASNVIVASCRSELERAAALYHHVQRRVRYLARKLSLHSQWDGQSAETTWQIGSGCCIDVSLLLTAMYTAIGLDASPVVLSQNDSAELCRSIPHGEFTHAITRVTVGGNDYYLDGAGNDVPFPTVAAANHGCHGLDVFRRQFVTIECPRPEDNGAIYHHRLRVVDGTSLTVCWQPQYTGTKECALRRYYRPLTNDERQSVVEGLITEENAAAILDSVSFHGLETLSKPFSFVIRYRLPHQLRQVGRYRLLPLPSFALEFPEAALVQRRYPLEYESSFRERHVYTIPVPPSLKVASLPKSRTYDVGIASYTLSVDMVAPRRLRIDSDYKRFERSCPVGKWSEYRRFLHQVMAATRELIGFEVVAER